MKKNYISVVIALLLGLSFTKGYSQDPDSLQRVLSSTRDPDQKINTYENMIRYYHSADPKKADQLIKELTTFSEKHNNAGGRAFALYHRGVYWLLQGKFDSVKLYAQKTTQVARSGRHQRAEAMGINLNALYFWHTGKMDSSINYHLQALKIRERIQDTVGLGASYIGLGSIYVSLRKYEDALSYLDKAISIGQQTGNNRTVVNSMHMKANVYAARKEYEKALAVDRTALPLAIKNNHQRGISQIYSNMANCYAALGQFEKSVNYHYKVLEIDKSFNDEKQIGDTYYNLASVYQKWGRNELAIDLATQAVALFEKTKYREGLSNVLPLLSDSYRAEGKYKEAFIALEAYVELSRKLFSEQSDKNISELKTRYETEKKEQQIELLNQQSDIQKLKLHERNLWLFSAGLLLVISISGAYFLLRHRRLKADANLQLSLKKQQEVYTRAILEAEEQERRRIAGDLHDGVGQILSVALLNLNSVKKAMAEGKEVSSDSFDDAVALVKDSYEEMRSISHQMMPNTLLKLGLVSAVREFVSKIDGDVIKASLYISGLNNRLNEQTETALFRIIQECAGNVIKHAKASHLSLQISHEDENICVCIEDNGIGFDRTTISNQSGLGLQNIRNRLAVLKGTLEIDSASGKGTVLVIHVPAESR